MLINKMAETTIDRNKIRKNLESRQMEKIEESYLESK